MYIHECARCQTGSSEQKRVCILTFFFFLQYLVQQVSRLGERYGNTGGHVAAGSVTVGETGHGSFSFQRGETQLDRFTQQ